jgi:hypothetical protein
MGQSKSNKGLFNIDTGLLGSPVETLFRRLGVWNLCFPNEESVKQQSPRHGEVGGEIFDLAAPS